MTKEVSKPNVPQVNLGSAESPKVANAQVAPELPLPAVPMSAPNPQKGGIEQGRGYVRRSQGYPVKPGQTWHDLTHQERVNYMTGRENMWKRNFGMENQSMQSNLNLTRG